MVVAPRVKGDTGRTCWPWDGEDCCSWVCWKLGDPWAPPVARPPRKVLEAMGGTRVGFCTSFSSCADKKRKKRRVM